METSQVGNAPTTIRSPAIATASGNTFVCLVRFALANIRRRPERFVLSVLGIALAIACVVVVRTISASFAITGADSVTDVLGGAQLWAVPAAGVHYDNNAQALVADGVAPNFTVPAGWTATRVLSGVTEINGNTVSLRGTDEIASGQATLGSEVAKRLDLHSDDRVVVGGQSLVVNIAGGGQSITVATPLAQSVVGDNSWWLIFAPPGDEKRLDLGQVFGGVVGLASTSDPSVKPDANGGGLIYDTVGGSGPLTFEQKFSALFSGKVTSSTLGLISTIGLGLGFVIAVSSFLAAVQERRREFGIMSSIGLADEVLYFFLVESGIVFLTAYLVGVIGA
ncbi:MAG: putative transport system permease protein, partial [Actinomycetota bacterium]|nr:putative transport system permease protein [Actinomycetota bacterium]